MTHQPDMETIVNRIIDARLADLAESMESAAYYQRCNGGAMESAIACAFDAIHRALLDNIEESAIPRATAKED